MTNLLSVHNHINCNSRFNTNVFQLNLNSCLANIQNICQQKEQYLTPHAYKQLNDIHAKIDQTIYQEFGFKRQVTNQRQPSATIDNNTINLCLDCITIELQNISSQNKSSPNKFDSQILQILLDVSDDLSYLSAHIKFTLDSDLPKTAHNFSASPIQ